MQDNKQDFSPIKSRILQYLENKGITVYKFYKNSGITRGILGQNNGISEENLAKFLAYATDINADWLLHGRGNMLNSKEIKLTRKEKEVVGSVYSQIGKQLSESRQKQLNSNEGKSSVDIRQVRRLYSVLKKKHPDLYKMKISFDNLQFFRDALYAIDEEIGEDIRDAFDKFPAAFDFTQYEQQAVEILERLKPFADPLNKLNNAMRDFYGQMQQLPENKIQFDDYLIE